jgi:polyvinyl alcohol dehydrogenase (cytochrome)
MLGGIHWGMAADSKNLYLTNSDNAVAIDKRIDSIKANPGVFALDIITGDQIWKAAIPPCEKLKGCAPYPSAAPSVIPGLVFAGSLDGHIRAYSSLTGETLWDFDTTIPLETCNGIKGNGGAIDGPAPVLANGMLFVNSGYGMFGQMPGNLLLAFEIDKPNTSSNNK